MKFSIFGFPLIKSALTLIALLLVSSCQTTSFPGIESDIQPISGFLKVGSLKYVKARSTKKTEYIYSNFESEAGIKITEKSAAIFRKIDSNVYSFEGNIVDYDVNSHNFSEAIDKSKFEIMKGLKYRGKVDTLNSIIDINFSSKSQSLSNEFIEAESVIKKFFKKVLIDAHKLQNKPIRQGDIILSLNINMGVSGASINIEGDITAVGTKFHNNRKVIVGEVDGLVSARGKNIKLSGYGYMDMRTGIWLYSDTSLSRFEIKDGVFIKISEIIKTEIESEKEKITAPIYSKLTGKQATNNMDVTVHGLQKGEKKCLELGFKKGTEKFGDCVVKLLPISSELRVDNKPISKPYKQERESHQKSSNKLYIQGVFKKGSKVCTWTDLKGNSGVDYFYKDKSRFSGSADRVIGDDMKQGTWQITGNAINLNWHGGKKGKGRWYKVEETEKTSFNLTTSDQKEFYKMRCK